METMTRRTFLSLSSVTALYLLTGCNSTQAKGTFGSLPIPDLKKPTDKGGIKHYDLNIVEAKHTFFEGIQTQTFAVDSTYLGPTLLLTRGDTVSINFTNQLSEETTMHGHGMHLPGEMDGTAHQPIAVGKTWSAKYTVDQKACTNWYHPHTLHKTAEHVYQGLAGLIIIEEDEIKALDLPNRYGIDDIPLVLQDRVFSSDKKRINYSPSEQQIHKGFVGDTFITNGAIEPTFSAENKEIRFRILNGSNSTIYELGFSDGKPFKQIASDNALLEKPIEMNRITLSPAERAEIVVDFTGDFGTSFTLHEYRYDKTFLTVEVNQAASVATTLPAQLISLGAIPETTQKRKFVLDMAMGGMSGTNDMNGSGGMNGSGSDMNGMTFTINGKSMDMDYINERLNRGDTEEWEIINQTNMNHNFHIHDTHFRVISRDDDPAKVAENEKGTYKDTVYMPPNSSLKFVIVIPDDGVTADDNNPYMYHCHFLEHEDHGMMGQWTVS